MRKRILSTLMALAMCLSLLPTTAFATGPEPDPAGTSILEVTFVNDIEGQLTELTGYYEDVQYLSWYIQQPTTTKIKLLDDIEYTRGDIDFFNGNPVKITGTLVLDLNGHEVNFNTDVEVWNSLTVIDSGEGGTLTAETLQVGCDDDTNQTGTLTLAGGTVNCPIDVAVGTLRVSGGEASDTVTVADKTGNGVTVTGGKLDELVIESTYGHVSMDISGGTIGTLEVPTAVAGDIRGGTFGTICLTGYNSNQVSAVDFLRTGYAFFDQADKLVNVRLTPSVQNVTVKAHTCAFTANTAWCDCGRLAKDTVTVPDGAIAMVDYGNFVNYITEVTALGRLFEDYNHSSFTLKLLGNVELPKDGDYAYAYINAPVTLDLNGHKLTTDALYLYSGSLTVMDSSDDENGKLVFTQFISAPGTGLTLNSGTMERVNSTTYDELYGTVTVNGGKLDYGQGTLFVCTSGGLTVNGGELAFTDYNGANIYLKNDAASSLSAVALNEGSQQDTTLAQDAGDTMRVNGGTVKGLISVDAGTTLTVTGGKIEEALTATDAADDTDEDDDDYPVWVGGVNVNGGSVNISGGEIRKLRVEPDIGGKVALSGGSFGAVYLYSYRPSSTTTTADFLADGYAYFDSGDNLVNAYARDESTKVPAVPQNVTVKTHIHNYGTDDTPKACACGSTINNKPVEYIDAYGKTQYCTDYTELKDAQEYQGNKTLNPDKWYVVSRNTTIDGSVLLDLSSRQGTVHLILSDGVTLTVNGSVKSTTSNTNNRDFVNSLTLYGQENGTGKMTVKGVGNLGTNNKAGVAVKNLTVNGGTLEIESKYAEGVSEGYGLYTVSGVVVNRGTLETKIAEGSAKITNSCGIYVENGDMIVNKGTVTANSGEAGSANSTMYISCGIYVTGNMTVDGGTVVAASGAVPDGSINMSIGVAASSLTVTDGKLYTRNGGAETANGAILYDLYAKGAITVIDSEVGRTSEDDPGAVLVWNNVDLGSCLTVIGSTMKLEEGSVLRVICVNRSANFGDLLKDGCGYYDSLDDSGKQLSGASAVEFHNGDAYFAMLRNQDGNKPIYIRAVSANDAAPVPYLDENGDAQNCIVYTELTQDYVDDNYYNDWALNLYDGWYVVKGDVTVDARLVSYAENGVHLILCNDATLTVTKGVESGENLTIYAQPEKTGEKTGKLTVNNVEENMDYDTSAIYTNSEDGITINGGVIDLYAYSKDRTSVGIDAHNGSVTINGGTVNVHAGKKGDLTTSDTTGSGNIGIYAHNLTVNKGTLTVTTGQLSAGNGYALNYGIEISYSYKASEYGAMTVTGGTVTTSTGKSWTFDDDNYSLGIYLYGADLTISGGTVTAKGGDMATATGDGTKNYYGNWSYGVLASYSDVTVTGGTLTATGGNVDMKKTGSVKANEAGSMGISGAYADLTISGGTVTAKGGKAAVDATGDEIKGAYFDAYNYGIYVYGMNVNGGTITATAGSASVTGSNDGESYYSVSAGIGSDAVVLNGGTLTATGGKASSYGESDSIGGYIAYLDTYDGTLTITGDRTADYSWDLCANSVSGYSPEDNPVEMHLYGGKVQSGADGGAVIFWAFGDQDTIVYGNTMKLAKGSHVYTLTTANGVKLKDLLDSGCCYSKKVTAYNGENEVVTKTKLTDADLSRNTLTGGAEWDNEELKEVVFYTVDAATTSSGGGSSSNTTGTTVKNPDGSTTTTTTDKKTGEVTETTQNPDGTTGTTVTDKDGNVTDVSANVPASAAKDGATVTLPIDEVNTENETEITVDVPEGGATIEIPVENPTPGTVVVIVDEDGNETIVPGSKVTENGVEVTLTEGATIKVIDNSKEFSDVKESDYFSKAVQWAAARNITGGIGGNRFGACESCTRAQLVTFLWRAAGQPEAAAESGMSDVAQNAYYTDAVAWAFENGIVGGYGNGLFGTDDVITREQVAVILYRFAQLAGMDTTQGGMLVREYEDYESISDFAVSAMQWAVNAGIMQGNNGKLMPKGECDRAQIVTMLYRLLGE